MKQILVLAVLAGIMVIGCTSQNPPSSTAAPTSIQTSSVQPIDTTPAYLTAPDKMYIQSPLYCEKDSDCVKQLVDCVTCTCPNAINKYNFVDLNCPSDPLAAGCALACPSDIPAKCQNNICTIVMNGNA
ncbi:MAG: hypothetical protein V1835_00715 [Candidatus Micrarchaeota archaeon]